MLNQYCFTKARPVLIIPIMYQHWFDITNRILINKVEPTLARIVNDGHSSMGKSLLCYFNHSLFEKMSTVQAYSFLKRSGSACLESCGHANIA